MEIGKRDLVQNNRLEMEGFTKSVTFSAVDLSLLMDKKPAAVQKMMAEIKDMFNCGAIKLVSPLIFYNVSEIQAAMRSMQAGKHVGKVVIETQTNDVVNVRTHDFGFEKRVTDLH